LGDVPDPEGRISYLRYVYMRRGHPSPLKRSGAMTKSTPVGGAMRMRKGLAFGLVLAVAIVAASLVALVESEPGEARTKMGGKIVFVSDRTTGRGVNNPTGDQEIFSMKPDGTSPQNVTTSTASETNGDWQLG
jgi:hypothetical protein